MGNVGIKTQSPAFDLDVSGVMKASKGIKIPYMNFMGIFFMEIQIFIIMKILIN